jgi:hypothetical protein
MMIWHDQVIEQASKEYGPLDDGFIYYFPSKGGALSAEVLRVIADELDRRNKAWDDDIKDYFATHPQNEEEESLDEL